MPILLNDITKITAESTPGFVRTVFECYAQDQVFAVARGDVAQDPLLAEASPRNLPANDKISGWIDATMHPKWSDAPAQIVFSSGTEGRPKAIVLSHRNLAHVIDRLNRAMAVTSEIREYIGVPVTYSFGLGRARAVATAGGQAYIPEKFDPREIRDMLARKEINAFSAVPSLCRILLKSKELFADVADQVRWIEIGSQFMSVDEKIAMRTLFRNARIIQHYGLTEASRSTFLDISNATPEELASVGRIEGGVSARIDADGAICLRGDHVAVGRIMDNGQIDPLTQEDGWLVTKDRGEIRDGALYFLGRLDDQINISGIKVSADMLEDRLGTACPDLVGHFAIAAVDDPLRGQSALLAVEDAVSQAAPDLEDALKSALLHYGVAGGEGFQVLQVDALPVTGSGKVKRTQLRDQFLATHTTQPDPGAGPDMSTVHGIFQSHFPKADITSQTRFDRLGGDSLSYMSVALDLERILGQLPDDWECRPIAVLEKTIPSHSVWARIDTGTLMRALAISLIVVGHLGALNYGGTGAFVLFFVAGMNFASLTVPAVFLAQNSGPVLVLLLRIAILTWAYLALNWAVTGYGGPLAFLFVSNWVDPNYPGGLWFIGVYLQVALVLAGLLWIPAVRARLQANGFATCAGLTAVLIGVLALSEQVVDTNHLYRRLPHLLGWMFLCGMTLHYADSQVRKGITFGLFILGWWVFSNLGMPAVKFILFAVPVLIFVPHIRLPRIALAPVRLVAGASLVIYLSHFQFQRALEILSVTNPVVVSIVAIGGGVVGYMVYRPIDDRIRSQLQHWVT